MRKLDRIIINTALVAKLRVQIIFDLYRGEAMKVAFLQFDVSKVVKENIDKTESMLKNIAASIVVLPELAFCGYLFDDKEELFKVAETVPHGHICSEMIRLSKEYDCALVFGMAEKEEGLIFNTAVVVNQGEYIGKYRKIHLTNYEKEMFCSGNSNNVFEVQGIKIGVQICFDLWFPEMSREQMLNGAQLLCVLANFGGETTYDISRIRAIENLTPLVLSNRVGFEKSERMDARFLGKSTIIRHDGKRLAPGEANDETYAVEEIEPNEKSNIMCKDFIKEISFHK